MCSSLAHGVVSLQMVCALSTKSNAWALEHHFMTILRYRLRPLLVVGIQEVNDFRTKLCADGNMQTTDKGAL